MDELKNLLLLIPIVLGSAGHFGLFIDSRKEFRNRVSLVHSTLKDNLTLFLTELLEHAGSLQDEPLRGDGKSPDKVMRYTSETWRTFDLLTKVARMSFLYKVGLYILFFAACIGVALIVFMFFLSQHSALILRVAVIVIAIEVIALVELFIVSNRFDIYEQAN